MRKSSEPEITYSSLVTLTTIGKARVCEGELVRPVDPFYAVILTCGSTNVSGSKCQKFCKLQFANWESRIDSTRLVLCETEMKRNLLYLYYSVLLA